MTEAPPKDDVTPAPGCSEEPETTDKGGWIAWAWKLPTDIYRKSHGGLGHLISNVVGNGRSVILAFVVVVALAGFYPLAFRFDLTAETRVVDVDLPKGTPVDMVVRLPIGHALTTGFSDASPVDDAATLRLDPGSTLRLASSGPLLTLTAQCFSGERCIVYTMETGGVERHAILIADMNLTDSDSDPGFVVTLPGNATYSVGGDTCAPPDVEVPGGITTGLLRTEAATWFFGGAHEFREELILLGDHVHFDATNEGSGTGVVAGSVYISSTGLMSVRIRGQATELGRCRPGDPERTEIRQDMFTLLLHSRVVQLVIAALAVGFMVLKLSNPNPKP